MSVELIPIVYWITQDSAVSYEHSLQGLVQKFAPAAQALLRQHAPSDRSGWEAEALVHRALFEMQQKLFNQYLPKLEPGRTKSVGCLWPTWEKSVLVRLGKDRLHDLTPLPEGNGLVYDLNLDDGSRYEYRFYRNDSLEQRFIWFRQAMKDEVRSEKHALGPDKQIAETADPVDSRTAPKHHDCAEEWHDVTDSDDWRAFKDKTPGNDIKVRKARSRAKARLMAALRILCRPPAQSVSRQYLERLRKAPDGQRKPILDEFLRRYPGEENET